MIFSQARVVSFYQIVRKPRTLPTQVWLR
jgi:hypothetical protein